jgi:hypothetical protein
VAPLVEEGVQFFAECAQFGEVRFMLVVVERSDLQNGVLGAQCVERFFQAVVLSR